jgi:hypothetical protein
MLEITQLKQKKALDLMSEMESDLTDTFRLAQNDVLNLVSKAEKESWTIEKLEIEMDALLIDDSSDIVDIDKIIDEEVEPEKEVVVVQEPLEKSNKAQYKIFKAKNAFDVASARDKISKKYKTSWKGKKYERLMSEIVSENMVKISEKVLKTDKKKFAMNLASIIPKGRWEKEIKLPDLRTIISQSPTILKAAQEGQLLTKTLRKRLGTDIKEVLLSENITTKKGTVNKNIQKKLQKKLVKSFENYTKKNPKFGVPNNIRNIAVTESRAVINNIRLEYVQKLSRESKDFEVKKKWIQNKSLSENPREVHTRLANGKAIPLNEQFNVNGYMAFSPHDPRLPPKEFIGCSCELKYIFVPKKTKGK